MRWQDTDGNRACLKSRLIANALAGLLALALSAPVTAAQPVSIGAYDFDGDGVGDLLVPSGGFSATEDVLGRVDVYSGFTGAVVRSFASGEANDAFGMALSTAGDVNGDGFDDVLVGAPFSGVNGFRSGCVTIYSGQDGSPLLVINGDAGSCLGLVVAAAGDINGDGSLEVLASSVIVEDVPDALSVATVVTAYDSVTGGVVRQFVSAEPVEFFGAAAVALGDIDADGFVDIAISDPNFDGGAGGAGAVYVFHGFASTGAAETLDTAMADATLLNSDPAIEEYGVALLPWYEDATGATVGVVVFSLATEAGSDPYLATLVGWDSQVEEARPFAQVFPFGDTDVTQVVDTGDVGEVLQEIGEATPVEEPFTSDLDGDGVVEVDDLSLVIENVGRVGVVEDIATPGSAYQAQTVVTTPIRNWRCCFWLGMMDQAPPICQTGAFNCPGADANPGGGPQDPGGTGADDDDNNGGSSPGGQQDGGQDIGGGGDPPCTVGIDGAPDEPVRIPCGEQEPAPIIVLAAQTGDDDGELNWGLPDGLSFANGSTEADAIVHVSVDLPGVHEVGVTLTLPGGQTCGGTVEFEAIRPCVDLDIDSDNDNGYEIPDLSPEEDEAEEGTGIKVLIVNRDDVNENGIPDYADGFGLYEPGGIVGEAFVPIVLDPGELGSWEGCTLTLEYDAADPSEVSRTEVPVPDIESSYFEYERGEGLLRVWKKDAAEERELDDFVPSGEPIDLIELDGPALFFVEAVNGSATAVEIRAVLTLPGQEVVEDVVLVLPFDAETGLEEEEILGFTIFEGSTQGTPGNDIVFGTDGPDDIFTGDGDDIIVAGDGDDVIDAGAGIDVVYAWEGYDDITIGGDVISGRSGSIKPKIVRRRERPDAGNTLMHTYYLEYGHSDLWMELFLSEAVGGKVRSRVPSIFTGRADWDLINRGNVEERYAEIQIEFDPNKPFVAARLLRKELIDCSIRWAKFKIHAESNFQDLIFQNQFDEEDDPLADLEAMQDREFDFAANSSAIIAGLYVNGIGVVSEGADIVVTISELSQGNVEAAVGFLPLVPATVVSTAKVSVVMAGVSKVIVKEKRVNRFPDHGLGWVERTGMSMEVVPHSSGVTIKLGTAQNTTHLPGDNHASVVNSVVDAIAQSGDADYIIMNRSLRTGTGLEHVDFVGPHNYFPDALYVDKTTGKIFLIEVRSPSQTVDQQLGKLNQMRAAFPPQYSVEIILHDVDGTKIY